MSRLPVLLFRSGSRSGERWSRSRSTKALGASTLTRYGFTQEVLTAARLPELVLRTKRISGIHHAGGWTFWCHGGDPDSVVAIKGIHEVGAASAIVLKSALLGAKADGRPQAPHAHAASSKPVASRPLSRDPRPAYEVVFYVNAHGGDDLARIREAFDEAMPRFNLGNGVDGRIRKIKEIA